MSHHDLERQAHRFLEALFDDLAKAGVVLEEHWDIDHLCFRTATEGEYEHYKKIFCGLGVLLVESDVNGRLIATVKLERPLSFRGQRIDVIEVPAPKRGKPTPTGFEHIEVVCDVPFAELEARYPSATFDRKGLEKGYNQELELCLGERNLKFHPTSLASVVTLERNAAVWAAIERSGVLSDLRALGPLVAGTFPLGLGVPDSDVDVLLSLEDLPGGLREFRERYGAYPEFSIEAVTVDGLPTVICRFRVDDVPFELFAQPRPAIRQTAYRHFLVEERLLKHGGTELRKRVRAERSAGAKTEEAFARALHLDGDPYQRLLELQRLGGADLARVITGAFGTEGR
jgi:predicted metalloenzyme YecM